MSAWELPGKILALSQSDRWEAAVKEWHLDDIEMLEPGESDECLCGHSPIRELCHIKNKLNGNTAIVGNHCIQKFDANDPGHEVFSHVPLVIQAARRILENSDASANPALIHLARQREIFMQDDATFYEKIWRKRKLSVFQGVRKQNLNRRLLYQLILSVKGAYQRLKIQPIEGTAGPKLAMYAFKNGAIRQQDMSFYLDIWDRKHGDLSAKQKKYKTDLNAKIIEKFKDVLSA